MMITRRRLVNENTHKDENNDSIASSYMSGGVGTITLATGNTMGYDLDLNRVVIL